MLERKIQAQLIAWKETPGKKSLVVQGARQVGKTFAVERFGEDHYQELLEINFKETPSAAAVFQGDLTVDAMVTALRFRFPKLAIAPGRTLLFFDEIQECPEAITSLKFWTLDGRYDVVASGSMLGIDYRRPSSYPVGYIDYLGLTGLDFEEFLWACGETQLAELIRSAHSSLHPLPDALHKKASRLMREYLLVGGMPQAVNQYLAEKDLGKVDEVKRGILELYANDVSRFGAGQAPKIRRLLRTIPGQLSKHEKKFTLAAADPNARSQTWEEAFAWLEDARMVNLCRNATDPSVALALSEDDATLKCYMADTGLLVTQSFATNTATSDETLRAVLFDQLGVNEGMLVENYVAQQLRAKGDELFFYSRYDRKDSSWNMEIDFLVFRPNATAPSRWTSSGRNSPGRRDLSWSCTPNRWRGCKDGSICRSTWRIWRNGR